MTIMQAEKKIRNAWTVSLLVLILGLISLASDLVEAIAKGGIANSLGTTSSLRDSLGIVLFFLFAFGIYRKSRIAAIGMFVNFLVGIGIIAYFLVSRLMTQGALSQDDVTVILIATAILTPFLYFSFEGVRGTITYHRPQQSHNSANQPVASLED